MECVCVKPPEKTPTPAERVRTAVGGDANPDPVATQPPPGVPKVPSVLPPPLRRRRPLSGSPPAPSSPRRSLVLPRSPSFPHPWEGRDDETHGRVIHGDARRGGARVPDDARFSRRLFGRIQTKEA